MKHYRSTRKRYDTHNKDDAMKENYCPFCDNDNHEIIEETNTMFVMKNRVKYDLFDGVRVLDHLLVIPKQHRVALNEFTDQEIIDAFRIAGKYEEQGYGFYGRGVGSVTRSVAHQHTHLLKLADTTSKLVVFTSKPYLLFER
jgi:diadenosine tetraphosphate (Ap4A) HIT family hydrolase